MTGGPRRVFVAGGGGVLGVALFEEFTRHGYSVIATDIELSEPGISFADVRDYASLKRQLDELRPGIIVNLAALTDLEHCETHEEEARNTNTVGAQNLGDIAAALSATYVYVSTAGIFDGKKVAYREDDRPNPLNAYGRTKLGGEVCAMEATKRHYVLRAGWMMGGGRKEKKFVALLCSQIRSGARVLHVVDDKSGSPTYTREFARHLRLLLARDAPYGVYHLSGAGRASRFEVAQELLRLIGREDVAIRPVPSEYFKARFFAPRPESEALLDTKLQELALPPSKDWRDSLREYIGERDFHETRV